MIYKEYITSKNGYSVPLYSDGMPSGSKYDPLREALSFGDDIKKETGFFVIAGIAGAFHIASLQKKFPEAKIVCIEADKDSLDFCINNEYIKQLNLKNIFFCCENEIESAVSSNYIPSLHGDFSFLYLRTWADKNPSLIKNIHERIQNILKNVSADYSVQCHFGKIWQRNILLNLKLFSENKERFTFNLKPEDLSKTAAIIAAGPSLDYSVNDLKTNRQRYFIFSTDTAYRSLLKQDVIPDAVVSIDGQSISSSHFYSSSENTQFIFDLCSSPSAINKIIPEENNLYFINTGHPLAERASEFCNFMKINSGSGTVTIAACDFALKAGFSKIKYFGSDFCYSFGKPYTKGTYLDENYYKLSCKYSPADNSFTNLMFRTETKAFLREKYSYSNLRSPFTTEILDSYKNTLNEWISKNKGIFENNCFVFPDHDWRATSLSTGFDYSSFIDSLLSSIKEYQNDSRNVSLIYSFLPYFAYKKSKISNNEKLNVSDFLKLEYNTILRYTYNYEAK